MHYTICITIHTTMHCSSYHQTSCEETVVSFLFSGPYSIITNKDDLTKENARNKQVLKKNIRKALIVKSLRELLTITACFSDNKSKPQISERNRSE